MKTSIIIPVKDNEGLTENCIESIKANTKDYEIIIVDNGSKRPRTFGQKYIRNNENLGFVKAVNQGIIASKGEIVVILNNDTIVTPNWIENLEYHFKDYDMVGPCTNSISGPQKIETETYEGNDQLYKFAKKFNKEHKGESMPWYRLVFYCVAIKREVINRLPLLDEQFTPGNFEDDDYCLRAIEAGFRLGIAQDTFIHHMGGATHKTLNIDFKKLMETNLAKFQKKWSEARYKELQDQNYINCDKKPEEREKTLALVMIVKNEEKGLERAILSCKDFVKEIIIAVDDSSEDKTLEIAKKYATRVKTFKWENDFAKARNEAAEGVEADWILFIDGHEFVINYDKLKEKLKSDKDTLLCTVELDSGAIIRSPRIYRNGLKFVGEYHEQINNKTIEQYTEFLIKHDRIGGQAIKSQIIREEMRDKLLPKIMKKQLDKNKRNVRALFHLALHEQSRGNFKKAIKWQNKYFRYAKVKNERWYVYFNRALCYLALNKCFRAFWAINHAENESPGRWETTKLKGMIYFQAKKYMKAIESLVNSFHINIGDQTYKPWKRDEAGTWNLIGESWFRLGNYFKAHIAFEQAWKNCTNPKWKKLLYDRHKLMEKMAEPQRSK